MVSIILDARAQVTLPFRSSQSGRYSERRPAFRSVSNVCPRCDVGTCSYVLHACALSGRSVGGALPIAAARALGCYLGGCRRDARVKQHENQRHDQPDDDPEHLRDRTRDA